VRRALVIAVVLGALGYAGVRLVDRVTTDHYGDPATPEGYLNRYVDHHLRLSLDRQQPGGQPSGRVLLRGRLRNGGDRPLQDVVVGVRYAVDGGTQWSEGTVHLGPFAPGQERTLDEPVGSVTVALDAGLRRPELLSEVSVEELSFAPTPGSRARRP